jgi:hypothetical protein
MKILCPYLRVSPYGEPSLDGTVYQRFEFPNGIAGKYGPYIHRSYDNYGDWRIPWLRNDLLYPTAQIAMDTLDKALISEGYILLNSQEELDKYLILQ